MSRAPPGPLSAPERAAVDRARVVPCPAHMHAHPTVVMTPCANLAGARRHCGHQFDPPPARVHSSDASLDRRRARNIKLWELVPVSLKPEASQHTLGEVSPAQPLQRPTFLDSIDHSSTLRLSQQSLDLETANSVDANALAQEQTESSAPRHKKRAGSLSPSTKSVKRTLWYSQQPHEVDRNPFQVRASTSPTSEPDIERRRPVRTEWHIRPTPTLDPQTPPTLRSRVRPLDLQTFDQYPRDSDSAPSSPLHPRSSAIHTNSCHRDEYGSRTAAASTALTNTQKQRQMLTLTEQAITSGAPAEALDGLEEVSSSAIRLQRPSTNASLEETPPRSGRRTLLAEFLGAKTDELHSESTLPNAFTTPMQSLRTRRRSFMDIDSPNSMPFVVPSTQPMPKLSSFTGSAVAGHVGSPSESPSSEARIQWTQSLETPPKKHVGSGAVDISRTNIINQLRGLPAHAPEMSMAPGEFVGWSPSMETPPRPTVRTTEPQSVIRGNLLERLRGMPQPAPPLDERCLSQDSQEDHYYSAASSITDTQDGYQGDMASSMDRDLLNDSAAFSPKTEPLSIALADIQFISKDDAASDVPSLPDSVGLTLPSSLVHELEHDTDAVEIGSPIIASQVFSSGQRITDPQDELQSSPPGGLTRHPQDPSSAGLLRSMPAHNTAAPGIDGLSALHDGSQKESDLRRDRSMDGTSISQDLDNMQLEPWSSPLEKSEGLHTETERQRQPDEWHHPIQSRHRVSSSLTEDGAHDDFADIRFSQLDDGFGIPDLVQKSQRMLPSSDDHTTRLTTGALIPQDSADVDVNPGQSSASVAPPPCGPIGFTRASGKKHSAPSRAALAHAAGLLECDMDKSLPVGQLEAPMSSKDDCGFRSAGGRKLAPISSAALAKAAFMLGDVDNQNESEEANMPPMMITSTEPTKAFRGFQSAGGKALAPISKAAQERATRFLEEDSFDADPSYSARSDLREMMMLTSAAQTTEGAPHSMGGFSSASGKKLAPVSKATLEAWSKQLAEDSNSADFTIETPSTASSKQIQTGFTGFASGNGKRLAPVSEAAKARALGILEVNDPLPVLPAVRLKSMEASAQGVSNLSPGVSHRKGAVGSAGTSAQFKSPAISSHMHKLKLKALRPISAATSQPSVHKTAIKATELSKSSRPFKPPLKAHGSLSTGTANYRTTPISRPSEKDRADALPDRDKSTLEPTVRGTAEGASAIALPPGRSLVVKRAALHPTARVASPSIPLEVSLAPDRLSHHVLFNVQGNGVRVGLSNLGPPQHHTYQSLKDIGVSDDVIYMSLASAKSYKFGDWGVDDAYRGLLDRGAKQELLSRTWLENHYSMIVWKLACYVRSWPKHLLAAAAAGSGWFYPGKVLDQLAYRYEREINRAERPAVRKIVEGDESPAKHMVLAMAGIERAYDEETKKEVLKVMVTDGWYVIAAMLDACLTRAAERGRLKVGSKIHVCQARLSGAENGVAIQDVMEGTSDVSIILQANATRLARWDKKLGFQKERVSRTTRLRNIVADGGLIPALDVVVLRKYPVMYMESLEDGTKIRRTSREEERAAEEYRESMQKQYHDMVAKVQARFGADIDGSMSIAQPSRMQDEIRSKVADLEAQAVARNVVPFFSIRVGDYHCGGFGIDNDGESGHQQEAIITFWHDDQASYQEGRRVKIMSVMAKKPSREHGQEEKIQLTGTRMSAVLELPTDPEAMLLTNYRPREITTCAEVGHLYHGAEFDLAVLVLAVGNWVPGSSKVFFAVTDASKRLLLVEHQMGTHRTALPTFLKCQAKILIANARYKLRDPKLDLDIVVSTQNYTHIVAASPVAVAASVSTGAGGAAWPSYALSSLLKLHELTSNSHAESSGWSQSNDGGDALVDLMARASAVLTGMQPCL